MEIKNLFVSLVNQFYRFFKIYFIKISKKNILVLPNNSDKGKSGWQPSLREYAKKKI